MIRPDQPQPWERRELPRKHERSPSAAADALGGGGCGAAAAAQRWRERELPRSSPSPGGTSSGLYSSTPSVPERVLPDGKSPRPSVRYGGSVARESRGSLRQRSPYRTMSDDSSWRPLPPPPPPAMTGLRSLAVSITTTAAQTPMKDQIGRNIDGKDAGFGMGIAQKLDRDSSLCSKGWKATKWSRPSSISLARIEDTAANEATSSSPGASPQDADDGAPRKKPRLGWGQGLAKYEKQKVQGSLDSPVAGAKNGVGDSSPGVTGPEGCLSSRCPFSDRCSLSPAITDEKPCTSETSGEIVASHCNLSGVGTKNKETSRKLDHFEVKSASSLKALLEDVLQPEDACSGDSTSTRHAAMNNLLLLKVDISKELEKTECEIDFLEGELKSLDSVAKSTFPSHITVNGAKISFVSLHGASKDYVQKQGHLSAISQAGPDHPISSLSSRERDTMPTDLKSDSSLACGCGGASMDKGISHVEQSEPSESTAIIDMHGVELQGMLQNTVQEQMTVTKCGDGSVSCVKTSSSRRYCSVPVCTHDGTNCNLISHIMESNREVAKRSSEFFLSALPSNPPQINIWELIKLPNEMKNTKKIREKIHVRKRVLELKKKVLTLKFMAFHQLWKEDLRLLSIWKSHTKSNKRFEISSRSSHSSSKLHSSFSSRFALSEDSLAPPTEVRELMYKLLSDSHIKVHRSNLRMPAMILDDERELRKFVHKNGLIEDPPSLELERSRVNPWTQEEKNVFMEMLAAFGKNFTKISSFLSHKTTADCIEYYYKNHKSESFSEAKKLLGITKQVKQLSSNTYLVTSGRKSNRETNAAALDMLGEASLVAARNNCIVKTKQKDNGKFVYRNCNNSKMPCGSYSSFDKTQSVELSVQERECVAVDVLAGISSALSSEGMSSCVTTSIGQAWKMNVSEMGQPLSQNFDEDSCSDEDCVVLGSSDWTDDEKSSFVQALSIYGRDFTKISNYLGTRSAEQCKTFFSKARSCLDLDVLHLVDGNAGMASDNTNAGKSDTDDACAADIDSAICSTQSCSKVTGDVSQPMTNANNLGSSPVQSEVDRSSEQDTMGGIDFAESCADKQESNINDDKLISGEDNNLSYAALKESDNAALSCNLSGYLEDNAEKMDTESRLDGSNIDANTGQHGTEAPIDVDAISHSGIAFWQNDTGEKSSSDMLKREVNSPHCVVSDVGSKNRRRASFDLDASSSVICFAEDLNGNENVLQKGSVVGAVPRPTSAPSYQHQEHHPHVLRGHPTVPFKQETVLSSALCDLSSICFTGSPHIASQKETTLNFQEYASRQHQNSAAARDSYQQYMLKNAQLNQSMHILNGYPLSMLNQKDNKREEHAAVGGSPMLDGTVKRSGFPLSTHFVSSIQGGISNCLSHQQLGSVMLHAAKMKDPSEIKTRHWSQGSQTTVAEAKQHPTSRPGDVKLFGKIITQPPSSQNANTSMQENQSKLPLPKVEESSNVTPSSTIKDAVPLPCRPGSSSQIGLSEQPGTSYGIWDGSRRQAGFPSLSDPTCIMATYRALGPSMPFMISSDGRPPSNIALMEYQQPYMQQLSSEGTRNGNFSLLQSRNGTGTVPGFNPSGSTRHLGSKSAGNRSIFVAGTGISDPVAALKMQYPSSSCSKVSETEFWRRNTGGR